MLTYIDCAFRCSVSFFFLSAWFISNSCWLTWMSIFFFSYLWTYFFHVWIYIVFFFFTIKFGNFFLKNIVDSFNVLLFIFVHGWQFFNIFIFIINKVLLLGNFIINFCQFWLLLANILILFSQSFVFYFIIFNNLINGFIFCLKLSFEFSLVFLIIAKQVLIVHIFILGLKPLFERFGNKIV